MVGAVFLSLLTGTVKKLNETWPTLEDTLSRVKNLCSQASPSVSMTDSIRRIKDVIEEARDIVKRVTPPKTL